MKARLKFIGAAFLAAFFLICQTNASDIASDVPSDVESSSATIVEGDDEDYGLARLFHVRDPQELDNARREILSLIPNAHVTDENVKRYLSVEERLRPAYLAFRNKPKSLVEFLELYAAQKDHSHRVAVLKLNDIYCSECDEDQDLDWFLSQRAVDAVWEMRESGDVSEDNFTFHGVNYATKILIPRVKVMDGKQPLRFDPPISDFMIDALRHHNAGKGKINELSADEIIQAMGSYARVSIEYWFKEVEELVPGLSRKAILGLQEKLDGPFEAELLDPKIIAQYVKVPKKDQENYVFLFRQGIDPTKEDLKFMADHGGDDMSKEIQAVIDLASEHDTPLTLSEDLLDLVNQMRSLDVCFKAITYQNIEITKKLMALRRDPENEKTTLKSIYEDQEGYSRDMFVMSQNCASFEDVEQVTLEQLNSWLEILAEEEVKKLSGNAIGEEIENGGNSLGIHDTAQAERTELELMLNEMSEASEEEGVA